MDILERSRTRTLLEPLIRNLKAFEDRFLRKRVWGEIQATIAILLWMQPLVRTSLKSACESFFDLFRTRFGLEGDAPDPGGLQRAIRKVSIDRLNALHDVMCTQARSKVRCPLPPWLRAIGRPILGVDGTTFSTARTPALAREFPVIHDRQGQELSPYPLTRLVVAWDLISHCPVTWWLSSIKTGERLSFALMLGKVQEPSVFVFDRGFPSREIFADLIDRKHWFIFRMVSGRAGAWPEVKDFLDSGKRSARVDIVIGTGTSRRVANMRLILRVFHRGRPRKGQQRKVMIVVTNIPEKQLDDRSVVRLYHRRWGIETGYREIKCFSATKDRWRSADKQGIERELVAVMIWYTLTALITGPLTHGAGMQIEDEGWRANTCVVLRTAFFLLQVLVSKKIQDGLILELERRLRQVIRWRQRKRPNRSAPRRKKQRTTAYEYS